MVKMQSSADTRCNRLAKRCHNDSGSDHDERIAKRSRVYAPISQSEQDNVMVASPAPFIKEEAVTFEEAVPVKESDSESDRNVDVLLSIPLYQPAQINNIKYGSILDEEKSLNRLLADAQAYNTERAQAQEDCVPRSPAGNALLERSLSVDTVADDERNNEYDCAIQSETRIKSESLYGDENAVPIYATPFHTQTHLVTNLSSDCTSPFCLTSLLLCHFHVLTVRTNSFNNR